MTNRSLISFLPLIALAALTGCATSQTTYLNNGEQGLSIDCSGEANSWATCYEKAVKWRSRSGRRVQSAAGN